MEGNIIAKGTTTGTVETHIKASLVAVARKVDGIELALKIEERFQDYVQEGRDTIKQLHLFIKEIVGEQTKLVQILKACNQSIIAPVLIYLTNSLEGILSFKQKTWKIQILIGTSVIRITHIKTEQSAPDAEDIYGPFAFEYTLDFILDKDASELKQMIVNLTKVVVFDDKKEKIVKDLLSKAFERFTPEKEELIHIPIN